MASSHGRIAIAVTRPTLLGVIRRSSSQRARLGTFQRLTQQFVELQNLDAALPHLEHEVEVILARFMHPKYVVEQQISTIARGQSLMRESGTTEQARLPAWRRATIV